ncbi:hypothetical protein GALMADRAFT_272842 [Galerina marginata CBS 339.88]|uniref:Methyltransferase-domain-containing protein n=1 Tax=Galerina marginata (strain CBS 339.88) TaxID=685588 RepID=A0A067SAW6_GALM3|nr:hypothetical protein GALMADRAFT_272842 [Galerina marginata CBS 339.88]
MFFYISFLRPPPLQAAPYGTISITPQISNDLRTEPFDGSQDLYYSWWPEGSQTTTVTKPTKLTTWRLATAYKEIPLPVPQGVREGQKWRLILTAQGQAHGRLNPESIDLAPADVGRVPFPVMSMPVLFNGKGHKGSPKQEMIERTYLIPFRGERADIEKTSFDLDKKIWDSGIGLSSWLVDLKVNSVLLESHPQLQDLHDSLFSQQPRRILELGAGIGIVSVALAVLRAGSQAMGEQETNFILATDVPSAMPLLEENISLNEKYWLSAAPKAVVLDWDNDEFPEEVIVKEGLDAIVMADVTYNTSAFPSLCRTLSRLVRLGSKPPMILLGYKERDEAERGFWDLAAEAGIDYEKIGQRAGAGGASVEIWLGKARV